MSKKFAIIGIAGYIAERHLKAIKAISGNVMATLDISDSVGILDTYFPAAHFFTEETKFELFIQQNKIDFLVVLSPNFLHLQHCILGLKSGINVICEKPLALTQKDVLELQNAEKLFNKKIYTILQLRLHPVLQNLKKAISIEKNYEVILNYHTPRGNWYHNSWKGNIEKSGGIATNIGIHFFDMLIWFFGDIIDIKIDTKNNITTTGKLFFANAKVVFNLSIDIHIAPKRQLIINNETIEFTDGFANLHNNCYEQILLQNGFDTNTVLPSIQLTEKIRNIVLQ